MRKTVEEVMLNFFHLMNLLHCVHGSVTTGGSFGSSNICPRAFSLTNGGPFQPVCLKGHWLAKAAASKSAACPQRSLINCEKGECIRPAVDEVLQGEACERSIHLRVSLGASLSSIAQLTILVTEPVVVTGAPVDDRKSSPLSSGLAL